MRWLKPWRAIASEFKRSESREGLARSLLRWGRWSAVVLIPVLVLALAIQSQIAVGSHAFPFHWQQNPGGGYPRWVPYHDHTNPNIYSDVFNHTFAHYYNADNNWFPYQVCNTCNNSIDGLSANYNDPAWIGAAEITYTGSHINFVTIKLDDADLNGRTYNEQHGVTCQEQGHAGGLNHRSESTTCLRDGIYGWPPPDFDQHDTDTIKSIHQHID